MNKLNEFLDENNPAHKIILEINKRNQELYGAYHDECGLFQTFCRCKMNNESSIQTNED